MIPGRQFAALQIKGGRDYQEDDFAYFSMLPEDDQRAQDLLMVLADGMGGHNGGAHASAAAVERFIDAFNENPTADAISRLRHALDESNRKIGEDSTRIPELEGMGCTLVAAAFTADGLVWVSVGDSPMWLYRDGKLVQLNEDHSMAPILAERVRRGDLSADDAAVHPHRNALRSAVVGEDLPMVDLSRSALALREGDTILLASDGVQTLTDDEIAEIMAEDRDAHGLAERLIEEVQNRNRRGQDNTTVMVVRPFIGNAGGRPSRSWADRAEKR
ncbi:MAG: PP2C family serine/threonine-protein phosphatase [Alphaproteobacteria bacterium]